MSWSLDSLLDLTAQEVRGLAWAAGAGVPADRPLAGTVVAVLPFADTTLPAAAWLAVAQRLGAGVLRADDLGGAREPFAACRAAAEWADVIVASHVDQGFARAAAEHCGVPVVSGGGSAAGDSAAGLSIVSAALQVHDGEPGAGGRGLHVAVCGDLRASASARSLLDALAALEATVLLVPAKGCDIPADSLQRLARRMGRRPLHFEARTMRSLLDMVDTVLLAPESAPQLPLFQEIGVPPGEAERRARREVEDTDVLFVATGDGAPDRVVVAPFRGRSVPEGRPHRTDAAALAALLRHAASTRRRASPGSERAVGEAERGAVLAYGSLLGLRCAGRDCVGHRAPAQAAPRFLLLERNPARLECRYCGARTEAALAGSREAGRYHAVGSADAAKVLDQNLVLFRTADEAEAAGFERSLRDDASA